MPSLPPSAPTVYYQAPLHAPAPAVVGREGRPRDEEWHSPLLVDLPPIPVRRVRVAAGSHHWTYRPDAMHGRPGKPPAAFALLRYSGAEQGDATMGKATAEPPPSEEPADEDDSAWGEALAASFGFDIRSRLPAERDKPAAQAGPQAEGTGETGLTAIGYGCLANGRLGPRPVPVALAVLARRAVRNRVLVHGCPKS